jgi:CRISPR-associated protein Csm3
MERIPAGSDFEFAFSLRYFEGDRLSEYLEMVAEGFDLLEKHYLGGSGSRGYGQVSVVTSEGAPMAEHLRKKAKEVGS